jgi:hypothetical protein
MCDAEQLLHAKAILQQNLRSIYTVSASERAGVISVYGRHDTYRFVLAGDESGLDLATRALKVIR